MKTHNRQSIAYNRIALTATMLSCCLAGAADLRQEFAEPPMKYATRPLWFWNNTTVTEEGIVEQMQLAHDKCGYGGFGILPFGKEFKPELSWRHEKYAGGPQQYNTYMSRLNLMLQNHGRHVADIAVLYPIATLQAGHYLDGPLGHYRGGVPIPEADYVDVGELLAAQLGRDHTFLHPEALDEKCAVEGNSLKLSNPVNHETYKVMVVPGHKTIYWSNLRKIKAFHDNGGKVIATGTLPHKSAEFGHDEDVVQTIEALFPGAREAAESGGVTASSSWPGHAPELVSDGSKETRWNAKDGTSGDQWLEIDFGKKKDFDRVAITEVFDRVTSYSIQCLEGDHWVDCADGTTLGDKIITFDKVTSSKVRLYIHAIKSDSASIAEFSVAIGDTPLADGKPSPLVGSRNAQGGMAVFLEKPAALALHDALDRMLEVYDVEFEAGKALHYIHKIHDGRHIYFFANLGKTPITTQVCLRGTLHVEFWNPHTGEISQPKYLHEKKGAIAVTKVEMSLLPTTSMFIAAQENK